MAEDKKTQIKPFTFSIIPAPRYFTIEGERPRVPAMRFPRTASSWDLAYGLIAGKGEKIPVTACSLREWPIKNGALPERMDRARGYALSVSENRILIASDTIVGYRNGIHTLSQLLIQADGSLPELRVIDWPDMETRCAHICYHLALDWMPESVPNFESLLELVKKLANFKYNAVLLEIDSMFPFKTDPKIPAESAFSPGQIKEITKTCSELGMEIIPLMQCLGHAYNVLRLPEYAGLRETPDTTQQYCPSNPDVYPLYAKLAGEIIDGFSPVKRFHIGGDESRRLGVCPECAKTAAEEGIGAVYGRHVGKAAEFMLGRGVVPLVWSDMIEHHPEALRHLPRETEIVYWKYNLQKTSRGVDFNNFNNHTLWAAPGVRFETSNHTMYKFTSAMQGISFLAAESKRMHCKNWLVTDWMKGIPYELSLIGLAYGAEEGWSGGRSMDEFSRDYTNIVFGAGIPNWWKVYSKLEIILPYCEDAQARLNDRLDRYDLSGLSFRERAARYTKGDDREEYIRIMEKALKSAEEAEKILSKAEKSFKRNPLEREISYLSARTNAHKARLGLAVDEAVRLLKFPVPEGPARSRKLAEKFDGLISEHDALRKKTRKLLKAGMFESHLENLLNVKFEPAARGWMEYFREALLKGKYLPGVLGEESAPKI